MKAMELLRDAQELAAIAGLFLLMVAVLSPYLLAGWIQNLDGEEAG